MNTLINDIYITDRTRTILSSKYYWYCIKNQAITICIHIIVGDYVSKQIKPYIQASK